MKKFFSQSRPTLNIITHGLTIIYLLGLSLLSLDSFDQDSLFWQQLFVFMIQQLPALLVFFVYLLSFRCSRLGGIMFIFLGLLSVLFFHTYEFIPSFLLISLPLFAIGLLRVKLSKIDSKKNS